MTNTNNYETPKNNGADTAYPGLSGLVGEEYKKYEPLLKSLGPIGDILAFDPKIISAMPEDYQKLMYMGMAYRLAELRDQNAQDSKYGKATAMVLDALINMYSKAAGIEYSQSEKSPVYRGEKSQVPLTVENRG